MAGLRSAKNAVLVAILLGIPALLLRSSLQDPRALGGFDRMVVKVGAPLEAGISYAAGNAGRFFERWLLQARLQEKERREREAKEAAERKGLIGSGDRSDRIRTYNFPQGRLTDHRINLTLYKLALVMEGDLDEVVHALQLARGAELLAELEQQADQSARGALA